jgi:hypothetical protein
MDSQKKKSKQSKKLNSTLWFQAEEEVVKNPYDYESQRKFIREAANLLNRIYSLYDEYQLKFHINEVSFNKCTWMLQIDALDTLRDCIFLIKQGKHRIVGKMFRDVVECLDLAHLIRENPKKCLNKWFNDKVIQHKEYREYIGKKLGGSEKEKSRVFYTALSMWTHHTYFSLKNSYSLGRNDMMVYDSHSPKILVLPQTISQYLWMLSLLIKKFIKEMEDSKLFTEKQVESLGVNV